jgi:hypothetical protein
MRKKKEDEKTIPEEFVAKPRHRKTARRKAYLKGLEERPDAANDADLVDGSEPLSEFPLPYPFEDPAVEEDIIIKALKREAARRKLQLWWFLHTRDLVDDSADLGEPISDLASEKPRKRRESKVNAERKRKSES